MKFQAKKIRKIKFCPIFIIFLLALSVQCKSTSKKSSVVVLAAKQNINGLIILGADLQLNMKYDSSGKKKRKNPYSDYAHTAVWIGKEFPYQKAIKMILWARNYYSQLRYIAFANDIKSLKKQDARYMYIGGKTKIAIQAGLKAWSNRDFRTLGKINSEKKFINFIQKKYNKGLSEKEREWLPL